LKVRKSGNCKAIKASSTAKMLDEVFLQLTGKERRDVVN